LWKAGIRYRKQYKVIGRPDFALVQNRIAIFCDSEFWHGYRWGKRAQSTIRTNRQFWLNKIEKNRLRDKVVNRELRRRGWQVLRFWGHQINLNVEECVNVVMARIKEVKRGEHH
jgi:DNA mismatch endonuclease (patch repair protein)